MSKEESSKMTPFFFVLYTCFFVMLISAGVSNYAVAQTKNNASSSNTTLSLMTNLSKGLTTYALHNVTMTTAQCDKARHLPIVPENKTIAQNPMAVIGYTAGREGVLKACQEAGK
jgi:hypothetical protein